MRLPGTAPSTLPRLPQDITSDDVENAGDEAVEDAVLEHAAGEPTAFAEGPNSLASAPATQAAAAAPASVSTGIMALLPSMTFPWPATSCVASNQRAAQMRDRRSNH